ncbi:MAG: Mpo1-like protein [Pseudomonadota bacterium]
MPRKIVSLFEEYEKSHKHPVNIAIHWVAEPVTIWAFMGLLYLVPYLQPWLMLFVTALLLLYFATLS